VAVDILLNAVVYAEWRWADWLFIKGIAQQPLKTERLKEKERAPSNYAASGNYRHYLALIST
jgi:hypothetical protein